MKRAKRSVATEKLRAESKRLRRESRAMLRLFDPKPMWQRMAPPLDGWVYTPKGWMFRHEEMNIGPYEKPQPLPLVKVPLAAVAQFMKAKLGP